MGFGTRIYLGNLIKSSLFKCLFRREKGKREKNEKEKERKNDILTICFLIKITYVLRDKD